MRTTDKRMPTQIELRQPDSLVQPLKVVAAMVIVITASAMLLAGLWELFLIIEHFNTMDTQSRYISNFVGSDGVTASAIRLFGFLFFAVVILTCVGVITFGSTHKTNKKGKKYKVPFEGSHHNIL